MPLSGILKPIALASALAFSTLGVLSTRYKKARYYFHSTIFLTTLGAASLWGLVITAFVAAFGDRFSLNYYVARSFFQMCRPLIGIDFDVEGEEHILKLTKAQEGGHPESAVIIGNHQSMADLLYLGAIFPKRTSIMAKKELKWSPLLGQYMTLSGAVFVDRKNRKDAVATVKAAGDDLKRKGISLWIFPEGTRASHPEPALLPFKMGAFHLAIQAQVPVIVCVCENYHHLFDGRTRFEPGRLRVKILPPIPTTGMTVDDAHKLADMARDMMLSTLKEISKPAPKLLAEKEASATPEPAAEKPAAAVAEKPAAEEKTTAAEENPAASLAVSKSSSKSETTTEDEMDDDAVVLKLPAAAAPAAEAQTQAEAQP